MGAKSTSTVKKWPIALAVIACVPGWLAWMDLLQFTTPARGVPRLRFTVVPAWEYVLIVGGPLVAVALVAWGTPFARNRALRVVVGLYVAALGLATLFAFVDKAPDWMVVVLLVAGFLFLGIITIANSEEDRRAPVEPTRIPETGPYVADELAKLAALKDSDVLTEEEFAAQKAKLLQ